MLLQLMASLFSGSPMLLGSMALYNRGFCRDTTKGFTMLASPTNLSRFQTQGLRYLCQKALVISVLSIMAIGLAGCFPVVATGVVTGALSVSDRRTTGAQAEDQAIEIKAFNRFRERFKSSQISLSVVSFNRIALVTGYVPDEATKAEAARLVSSIENVRNSLNEIVVGLPPSIRTYGSDTVLTTRVKASMLEAKDLQAQVIKVYTESSTVFLMGIVTEREANRAADIASRVSGVRRVVRAFETISEADLSRMQLQTGGNNPAAGPPKSTPPSSGSVPNPPSAGGAAAIPTNDGNAVVTPIR
ncbi:MAG: BON domain-containing protein [Betaproteobacteria bacterium]|jgi:osmotically-inducible protein OsmY|nr:BON domain-containing protein [Betaproteobacteria bacterium]